MAVRQNTHAVAASSARRFEQIAQFDQIPKPNFEKKKGV
jgi:hypothetical protein